MINELKKKIKGKNIKLVFTEGDDLRVLTVAVRGKQEELFIPLLVGKTLEIKRLAKDNNLNIEGIEIIDVDTNKYYEAALKLMIELRKGKQTEEECAKLLKKSNYLGTMLVKMKLADALLGGATYSTADTIRPALQLIKTKPGISTVSSSFLLLPPNPMSSPLVFGDCAVIIAPSSEDLASIAISTAETARFFGLDPKVALLSFSSLGSAKSEETLKVAKAYSLLKDQNVWFPVIGEIQFDAAISNVVAKQKVIDVVKKTDLHEYESNKRHYDAAGYCNVFIFPSLDAGNIGYKIAARLGGYEALGPILQGLNAPINDLSRGANIEEIYKMAIVTVVQALA